MKVLIITGSPRTEGSCEEMAEDAAQLIKERGLDVEILSLANRTILPCTACDECVDEPHCPIDDAM